MGHQQARVMMVMGDQVTWSMQLRMWRIQDPHTHEFTTGNHRHDFPFFSVLMPTKHVTLKRFPLCWLQVNK